MVIPLPVEEQCRGVLSEPLPNLQLLTGTSVGLRGLSLSLFSAFFSSTFMAKVAAIPLLVPAGGGAVETCPRPGLDLRLSLKEGWLYFTWKLSNSKRSERGQSHGPLRCAFQTPSGILSANHYAKPHASQTSQTPTLNLQLHPFILFLTVPPHPEGGGVFRLG